MGLRRALVVLVVAGVAFASAASSPEPAARADLLDTVCHIGERIDLLDCTPEQGTASAASATSAAADQSEPRPALATFTQPRFDEKRLVVTFARDVPARVIGDLMHSVGVVVERAIPQLGLYSVRATPSRRNAALRELAASPLVAGAEREILVGGAATTPNDDRWPTQAGLRVVGLPAAWDLSRGAKDLLVAVIDSGVDAGHPDLAGAVDPGWDFVNGDSDAADDHGHGTAVAGVIAAHADNRQGVAGVCWLCRVVPVKVLGADGSGTSTAVAEGIVWAANRGADVINLSLGAPDLAGALDEAVGYAIGKGAIVVAAAGNDGVVAPFFPAAVAGVVGVAATNESDHFYSWSNRGPWVAVAAPGCNPAPLGQGYGDFCGTSSAAPVVAGIAALAVARRPSLTPAEFMEAITSSATSLGGAVRSGRVNAAGALALIRPESRARKRTVTYRGALAASTRSYRVAVGAGPLTATIRSSRAARLTLTLEDASGRRLGSATGRSPVRITKVVDEGIVVARVRGPSRTAFVLELAHIGSDHDPAVVLSSIPDVELPANRPRGPELGRPRLGDEPVLALGVRISDPEPIEMEIFAAINRLRKSHGLRQLTFSSALARAGDAHVRALGAAGQFTHDWTDGRPFARWIPAYYRSRSGVWSAGENLLWSDGELAPQQALEMWLESPSHKEIMLTRSWRELGVGVIRAEEAGGVYGGRSVYVVAAEFGLR